MARYDGNHSSVNDEKPSKVQLIIEAVKKNAKIENPSLLGYMIALIVIGTGNKIMLKLQTAPMANYTYFLSQLTTVIYLPIFFGIVFFQFMLPKYTSRVPVTITEDMVNYPKRHFLVMGILDSLAGVLILFGATNINGKMTVLLSQGVIPITMVCTKIFMYKTTSYKIFQYIGASVIFGGIIVTLIPSFQSIFSGDVTVLLWSLCFFAGNIPTALSSVYKEIAFKNQDMDIYYLSAWVALFQFLIGLALAVPTAPLQGSAIQDIPESLWHGLLCWMLGYNSITTGPTPDQCGSALFYTCLYMAFNIVYNILIVLVMKYGSAALMFIVSAVIIPLANICFTFRWLIGDQAQPFSITDIIGLVIILTGLIMYKVSGSTGNAPKPEEDPEAHPPAEYESGSRSGDKRY